MKIEQKNIWKMMSLSTSHMYVPGSDRAGEEEGPGAEEEPGGPGERDRDAEESAGGRAAGGQVSAGEGGGERGRPRQGNTGALREIQKGGGQLALQSKYCIPR